MMKRLRFLLILVAMLSMYRCTNSHRQGGSHTQERKQLLNDSINMQIEKYVNSAQDTASLIRAIELCDKLLLIEEDAQERYNTLQKKVSILGILGKFNSALKVQGEATELLDTNDVRRLEYAAMKYRTEGDSTMFHQTCLKVIKVCNDHQDEGGYAIKKATYLIKIGKERQAKDCLKDFLKRHDDEAVRNTLYNFQLLKKEVLIADSLIFNGANG